MGPATRGGRPRAPLVQKCFPGVGAYYSVNGEAVRLLEVEDASACHVAQPAVNGLDRGRIAELVCK